MDTPKFPRDCWYVAGLSQEFEVDSLKGQKMAGSSLVLWRTREGNVVAFDNRCCHKRFPLSEGRLMENGTLECAYHGICYDAQGKCVRIPSQLDAPIPPQAKLRPFPVMERDGLVWVWTGKPERASAFSPPRTPELVDPKWKVRDSGPMDIPANFMLTIENLLDITHFYPLHDGNIGDFSNSQLPIDLEEDEKDGYRYVKAIRRATNYKQPPFFADWFHYDLVDREHTHCMLSPGIVRVELRVAPPGELGARIGEGANRGYLLFHTTTPVDDRNHVWRWIVACPAEHMSRGDPSQAASDRIADQFPGVVAEDRWALERQQKMMELPEDDYSEVFLKSDKAMRRARQIVGQMQREEAQATGVGKTVRLKPVDTGALASQP